MCLGLMPLQSEAQLQTRRKRSSASCAIPILRRTLKAKNLDGELSLEYGTRARWCC